MIVHTYDIMGNLYFEFFAPFVPQNAQKVQNPYYEERKNDDYIKAAYLRYAFTIKMIADDFLLDYDRYSLPRKDIFIRYITLSEKGLSNNHRLR